MFCCTQAAFFLPPTTLLLLPWLLPAHSAALDEKTDRIIQRLIDLGQAQSKTPAQVAIAWILANDDVTAPIIGPDRPEHVEEVFGALEVEFNAEDLKGLDELSQWQPLTRSH